MKEHINNTYKVEQVTQHIYHVVDTKVDGGKVVYVRMNGTEADRICKLLNAAYADGWIAGGSEACRELCDEVCRKGVA